MKTTMRAAAIAAVALATTATAAHADTPTWCKRFDGIRKGDVERLKKESDPIDALTELVGLMCDKNNRAEKDTEYFRAEWGKRLQMTDADWADVGSWADALPVARRNAAPKFPKKKGISELTPLDQYGALIENENYTYFADAMGDKLTEVGRLAYILRCIHSESDGSTAAANWAVCQPDIDALDRGKLAAEIRSDTAHSGLDRTMTRVKVYLLDATLKAHAEKVKAIIASDKAYATMFQAAAGARKAYKASPELTALALAMDDARLTNSTKLHEGCLGKTEDALRKAISAIPAKTFEGLRDDGPRPEQLQIASNIASAPDGYLAGLAYFNCRWSTGDGGKMWSDTLERGFADALRYWPGFRGPRSAAYVAVLEAKVEPDDRSNKLVVWHPDYDWMRSIGGGNERGQGAIESVKVTGATAVVSYVKKLVQVSTCSNWVETNRLTSIRDNGDLVWDMRCTSRGTKTINLASPPQTVRSVFATGLKPGMIVWTAGDVVLAAFPKGGKAPTLVLGAPVK